MSVPASQPTGLKVEGATAASLGLWQCRACRAVCEAPRDTDTLECPRCNATVRQRLPDSVSRCWALLVAAIAMYIPANLLPVTVTSSIFDSQSDTIFSGIVYLWIEGSWPLATLVFVASMVVPLFKLLVLSYLLISVKRKSSLRPLHRTKLYRALEVIGRWSMLDVYIITWLAALVQIQALASITPGPGAMAFGSVVVLTMLATQSFDSRLIWAATDSHRALSSPLSSQLPSIPPHTKGAL